MNRHHRLLTTFFSFIFLFSISLEAVSFDTPALGRAFQPIEKIKLFYANHKKEVGVIGIAVAAWIGGYSLKSLIYRKKTVDPILNPERKKTEDGNNANTQLDTRVETLPAEDTTRLDRNDSESDDELDTSYDDEPIVSVSKPVNESAKSVSAGTEKKLKTDWDIDVEVGQELLQEDLTLAMHTRRAKLSHKKGSQRFHKNVVRAHQQQEDQEIALIRKAWQVTYEKLYHLLMDDPKSNIDAIANLYAELDEQDQLAGLVTYLIATYGPEKAGNAIDLISHLGQEDADA